MSTEARDRIWSMFNHDADYERLDHDIDEVLQLTAQRVTRILTAVPAPCAHSRVCELPAGHDGLHRIGPLEWPGR
ncbi:MAG TPA: hypothetical protein VNQ48_00250 [Microbacteriaceae bacterium]|nr:hypothetical protein [Microbacteriaceae bacterium]